ncbi:hypothetical protein F2Q69_00037995 [Brassica cretica]|uniref:Uncharacterized protein n=1 Tax=Brassica cretica TaxID=69181 RepID=A0A8S9SSS3_BRACR|nr:hypothetical protein F2Q69_00037995 [Brassica cretica]
MEGSLRFCLDLGFIQKSKKTRNEERERATGMTVRIRPSRIVLRLGGGGLVKTRSRESRVYSRLVVVNFISDTAFLRRRLQTKSRSNETGEDKTFSRIHRGWKTTR